MYFLYLYSDKDFRKPDSTYGYWTGKSYVVQDHEYPIIYNKISSEKYQKKKYKYLKRAISGGQNAMDKYMHVCGFDVEDEDENVVYRSYNPPYQEDNKNNVKENISNVLETFPRESKKWVSREGYALTLNEIHFLFREYLSNYDGDDQLETKRIVEEIKELRSWITNAAIYGDRL